MVHPFSEKVPTRPPPKRMVAAGSTRVVKLAPRSALPAAWGEPLIHQVQVPTESAVTGAKARFWNV